MVAARRLVALVAASVVASVVPAACSADAPGYLVSGCRRADLGGRSVARVWDEALLQLARQVIPNPTVNARNLFHLSAAMWDAWAVYDAHARGYVVTEKQGASDVTAAREAAISFAAYRLLLWRYGTVSDLAVTPSELGAVMASLCYRTDVTTTGGTSPAAVGNRIAQQIIERGRTDGALEDDRYVDHSFRPANDPLVVTEPGTTMRDPNAWQPLSLGRQIAQNGLPIAGNVQAFASPHWGRVTPFALTPSAQGTPIDPGPPARLGDAATDRAYKQAAIDVLRYSAQLDPSDGVEIDVGPGQVGGNALGANDGSGHAVNPSTGAPYAPVRALRADYWRAVAEYWADGPHSETPPGHWNLIANQVASSPGFTRRLGGQGPVLDPLRWDVEVYFALNGALHDAAIAAWGLKGFYDSARPISMIRYLGGNGQSSDPAAPSYHEQGLPLVPGLVEVVTPESSAPGGRHEALAGHLGDIAVRAWRGFPSDPTTQTSGVGWIRAVEWVPYQRSTFVTPAFAGYVSGHSTFSRAAAEVLAAVTGSAFFPGGLSTSTTERGALLHELGPTRDVVVPWATYFDAADQAGLSRLAMGIHTPEDDVVGRRIGATVGAGAWRLAQRYFDGSPGG